MDINKMTRKQFEELPYLDEFENHNLRDIYVDSIVLLPSRIHHDSGYNVYEVVVCNGHKAIGKCYGYDTFSIYMESEFNRVGIDCLRGFWTYENIPATKRIQGCSNVPRD